MFVKLLNVIVPACTWPDILVKLNEQNAAPLGFASHTSAVTCTKLFV